MVLGRGAASLLAVVLAATSAAASPSSSPRSPATSPVYAGIPFTAAVGWVDPQGQPLVAQVESDDAATTLYLVIDGMPGGPQTTAIAWPGPPVIEAGHAALATDGSELTVAVHGVVTEECDAGHAGLDACPQLWVSRYHVDGTPVAPTVVIRGDEAPIRGLADGSVLTASDTAGDVVWRGADGAERGRLGAGAAALASAAVDSAGRLLAGDTSGLVTRHVAGMTTPDLTVHDGCSVAGGFVVAAGTLPGFATACGVAPGRPAQVVVRRYDDSGGLAWSTTSAPAQQAMGTPAVGTIDGAGRVWLGGCAESCDREIVRSYTAGGSSEDPLLMAGAPVRLSDRGYPIVARIDELRPVATGGMAMASDAFPGFDNTDHVHPGFHVTEVLPRALSRPMCVTSAPTVASAGAGRATVAFTGCAVDYVDRSMAPSRYRIDALDVGGATVATTLAQGSATTGTVVGLGAGQLFRFQVRPENDAGVGPAAVGASAMTPPFPSIAAFVSRQLLDLAGRAPTPSELAGDIAALEARSLTPVSLMDELRAGPWLHDLLSIDRAYRAFFFRPPDTSGLRHWAAAERARPAADADLAAAFGRSAEFERRYGALDDRTFVEQLYRNALGRAGDRRGVDWWTWQLASRSATRWAVVLAFATSQELAARTHVESEVVQVAFGLLDRAPTPAELSAWVADETRVGADQVTVDILGTAEYAARIS